jgi:hypothetical protein
MDLFALMISLEMSHCKMKLEKHAYRKESSLSVMIYGGISAYSHRPALFRNDPPIIVFDILTKRRPFPPAAYFHEDIGFLEAATVRVRGRST